MSSLKKAKLLKEKLFQSFDFEELALEIFDFQYDHNPFYQQFLKQLKIVPQEVKTITQIPFLPIQFFKSKTISCHSQKTDLVFESSGTTSQITSKNYVYDMDFYRTICEKIVRESYGGALEDYHFLALLPSYLERQNSSLVQMAKHFISKSKSEFSGFYLSDTDTLEQTLEKIAQVNSTQKVFILGVTFAWLDWINKNKNLSWIGTLNPILMETGGMKGRREELIRDEVHDLIKSHFNVPFIHSEYGMTELFSQAYAKKEGKFLPSFSLKILLRELNDPFCLYESYTQSSRVGGINAIDLANIDSCSFIETEDLGIFLPENHFSVLGRIDTAEIRGCSQLVN